MKPPVAVTLALPVLVLVEVGVDEFGVVGVRAGKQILNVVNAERDVMYAQRFSL
jgi:hypothetical protein